MPSSTMAGSRSRMAAGVAEGIESPIIKPQGILTARIWERGELVDERVTRNTIVNHGVAAMALSLLPTAVSKLASPSASNPALDSNANHYGQGLALNHWRMGANDTTPASAPSVDDTDLENRTGTLLGPPPLSANGAGPWHKPLTGSNITIKSLSGVTLNDTHDADAAAGFTVEITMGEAEANDLEGSTQVRKVYREAGLFFYYPTGATPANPFPGTTSSQREQRLFARATLDTLVKTPTRSISLAWRFAFPAS